MSPPRSSSCSATRTGGRRSPKPAGGRSSNATTGVPSRSASPRSCATSRRADAGRRASAGGLVRARSFVLDHLVGGRGAAGDAPQLGLVDDLVRGGPVPRLGRDVDPPYEDQ